MIFHMQINIEVSKFKEALSNILSVVDKKNSRLILNFIHLKTTHDSIELSATDLEVSARIVIPCIVENHGEICVNAKNIFDIIKELPDDNVNLMVDQSNTNLKIKCRNINFTLLLLTSEEYPHLHFNSNSNRFELKSEDILSIINKTNHAISTDETRIFLNGIYLHEIDGKLRSIATDGYRLAIIETDYDSESIDALVNGIILPRKGVNELKKIAEKNPNNRIQLSMDDSYIYMNANEKYFLAVRLIAKDYLKYQSVIPKKSNSYIDIDRVSFLNALKRIRIMANERSNGVKIHIKENELMITANHPSLGDASEKLPIRYSEKEFEIGFNAKFLIECVSSFEDEDIRLEFNNELSAVTVKSLKSANFLCVIMPLRL